MRFDQRENNQLRPVKITTGYLDNVKSSVLIEFGGTKVICAANYSNSQPPFLMNTESGWVTAEYSMLPFSTPEQRCSRERGKVSGRTQEIQRLIGRSLRAVTDLNKLNKHSIIIDCDVLQADGGTRTASITGAYVSLNILLNNMKEKGLIAEIPLYDSVSAVSVGILSGNTILDLNYREDSNAEVDMNFVMTGDGGIVEIQGTAEEKPFSKKQMDEMFDLAFQAIKELTRKQLEALGCL